MIWARFIKASSRTMVSAAPSNNCKSLQYDAWQISDFGLTQQGTSQIANRRKRNSTISSAWASPKRQQGLLQTNRFFRIGMHRIWSFWRHEGILFWLGCMSSSHNIPKSIDLGTDRPERKWLVKNDLRNVATRVVVETIRVGYFRCTNSNVWNFLWIRHDCWR